MPFVPHFISLQHKYVVKRNIPKH